MCKLSLEEKEHWGKELSEFLQERRGFSAERLEDSWKRWTLKDFSKWRCGSGGGENSWPGSETRGTAQAKARGHETGAHSVGNGYCEFGFAFSPHSSSRGWNHCCHFPGQEICPREGEILAPGGTDGERQGSPVCFLLLCACPGKQAAQRVEQRGQRERNALRPGASSRHREGAGRRGSSDGF